MSHPERLLQATLDALQARVAVLDHAGRILLVNKAWQRGHRGDGSSLRNSSIGRHFLEVCAPSLGPDLPLIAAGIAALTEERPEFLMEYQCCLPGPSAWFTLRAGLVDIGGERFVVMSEDDVSAHRQTELKLAESNARLALALDAGGMGTWDLDLRTGVETWNEEHYRLFGVEPASFTPSPDSFNALVQPEDCERIEAIVDEVLDGRRGDYFDNEYRINRPDGSTRWICGGGRLLRDADGRPTRLLGISFDITQRKTRELEVEAANRAKSQFLAAMSHEIRTPLTGVLGMADLLAADELTVSQQRYLETIRTSGQHLLSIINDILDFSRIEAGRLELEQIDFVPSDLLEQVRSLLSSQATEQGLVLRIQHIASPTVVQGDPTRLRQVLLNLTGNALKFTTKGEVVVSLHEQATAPDRTVLRFEVRDSGIGIPLERQAQLFDAFVQADSSISRHYGGSGLGLTICKRLVEAMGGTIGVDSVQGRGSTFWFELSMALGDHRKLPAQERAASKAPQPLRVLVVDDVAVNRELLSEMLSRVGHEVDQAEDGARAVTLASGGGFDVVLMDVQMPVMDGLEATRRIRQLPVPIRNVPIFALSANVIESEQKRYLINGMDACLTKPVIWDELFAVLATITPQNAGGQPAAFTPAAQPAMAPIKEQSLLDLSRLDAMASKMPTAVFQQMLARGLAGAKESCHRLQALSDDLQAISTEAHRLRGTAGTFGLARISALAALIEDHAGAGEQVGDLVMLLEPALEATHGAIQSYD